MTSTWWGEERRGDLLGYGLLSGRLRVHLVKVLDAGPGANDLRPVCGGLQGLSRCDSGLDLTDQAACEAWKRYDVTFPAGAALADVPALSKLGSLCPRCVETYNTRLGRERARAVAVR